MSDNGRREVTAHMRATPAQIWRALTDPKITVDYYYGTEIKSDWTPGARWTSTSEDELYLDGEIVEIDAPRKLVQTFHVSGEEPAASDPPSLVTWEITPIGDETQVRVVHERLGAATAEYVEGGWEHILGGLKRVVESE